MAEAVSTKLLLSTTRPGPFISGSTHSILSLGQRPLIGKIHSGSSCWFSGLLLLESTHVVHCLEVLHTQNAPAGALRNPQTWIAPCETLHVQDMLSCLRRVSDRRGARGCG